MQLTADSLQIPQRIPLCVKDIPFDIHPESHKEINDQWRTHGKERNIDKVFTDRCGGDAHLFADSGANPEYVPLNKMLEPVHEKLLKQPVLKLLIF